MNLMGKIFTFMIFLMSTVFLVVSIMVGASDRNWKREADEEKTKAASATSSIDSLRDETAKLEKTLEFEKAARSQQLQNLQSLNLTTREQLDETSKKFFEEQKISQGYARELEEANNRLADQDAQLAKSKRPTRNWSTTSRINTPIIETSKRNCSNKLQSLRGSDKRKLICQLEFAKL